MDAEKTGLKMNVKKTKTICKEDPYMTIDQSRTENVEKYIYMGHQIQLFFLYSIH